MVSLQKDFNQKAKAPKNQLRTMKVQQERLRTEGQNLKLLACSSYATSLNIYLVKSTLVLN